MASKNTDKTGTGKPLNLYLTGGDLAKIRERREKAGKDASEGACVDEARGYARAGIEQALSDYSEVNQLRFLVNAWQSLINHAEVFAPELQQNDRWLAMRYDLEQRTDQAGVTAFIRQVGEKRREQIENDEAE